MVPPMGRDRHPQPIQPPDLGPAEPAGLVQHHRHHEEGGHKSMSAQDRQRAGVLVLGGVVEGHQQRLGRKRDAGQQMVYQTGAADGGVARPVQGVHLGGEHSRWGDQPASRRAVGRPPVADLVVGQHWDVVTGGDQPRAGWAGVGSRPRAPRGLAASTGRGRRGPRVRTGTVAGDWVAGSAAAEHNGGDRADHDQATATRPG